MRIYRTPILPIKQIGGAFIGILAAVGLWLLATFAATTLHGLALLVAGSGITIAAIVLAWYAYSIAASIRWHYRQRRLDREENITRE